MLVFRLTTCTDFYTRCKMSIFVKKKKERITITGGQLGSNNFSHEHTTLTSQDFFVSWRMVFGVVYVGFPFNDLYWFTLDAKCRFSWKRKRKESLLLGVNKAPITFLMSTPRLPIKIFSLAEGLLSVLFMLVFRLTTCTDFYTRCKMSIFVKKKKKESLLLGVN